MAIDFNKPVQTRDGRKVRILCTDGQDLDFPVVGFIEGSIEVDDWTILGSYQRSCSSGKDLVNAPKRIVKWFNLYHGEAGMAFDNKDECVMAGERQMLCVVKVTFLDGKPISSELEDF